MALGLPLATLAQPASSDPAQRSASAAPLHYRSAFADYKPYKDATLADWRGVNDAVARAAGGGHAGHSMPTVPGMSQMPAPKAASPLDYQHGGKK